MTYIVSVLGGIEMDYKSVDSQLERRMDKGAGIQLGMSLSKIFALARRPHSAPGSSVCGATLDWSSPHILNWLLHPHCLIHARTETALVWVRLRRHQHQSSICAAVAALDGLTEPDNLKSGAGRAVICRRGGHSNSDHSNKSAYLAARRSLSASLAAEHGSLWRI